MVAEISGEMKAALARGLEAVEMSDREVERAMWEAGVDVSREAVATWRKGTRQAGPDFHNAVAQIINRHLPPKDRVPLYAMERPPLRVVEGGRRREDRLVKKPHTSRLTNIAPDLPVRVALVA